MARLGLTGRLADTCGRHPWRTLLCWLLLLGAAFVLAGGLGDVLTDQQGLTVETDSIRGDALIEERLTGVAPAQEFIVVEAESLTFSDPGFVGVLGDLVASLRGLDTVSAVVSPLDGAPGLVSADGTVALVVATLAGDPDDAVDNAEPLVQIVKATDDLDGYRAAAVGNGSISGAFNTLAEETLVRGETLGIPTAIVILIFVLGAVVAAGVPLIVALMSIFLAFGLSALVGKAYELSFFVVNMIMMIGLAVGIDYTLFIVQRYREERAQGRDVHAAVVRAADTATRAVVFSGMTVVIALLGLMYMPDNIMRSLGIGAIVVVIATGLAATTALPAILRLLGDRINKLRVPFSSKAHYHEGGGRMWHRITQVVTARPAVSIVLAAGVLLAAASSFLTMETGQNFIGSLPDDSDSVYGWQTLNREFDTGAITTPVVVAADDVSDPAIATAVESLIAALDADPAYGEVTTRVGPAGDVLVLDAVFKLDPSTAEAKQALVNLRSELIPAAFAGVDAEVVVTGNVAYTFDYAHVIGSRSPVIIVFVLALSFVLLMMIFRSIVVPLKAIIMNLLSVGAAYGMLVLVFQHGIGAGVLGLRQTDVIEVWIPMFLFTVLFGLSMDYHIFLLSRIKENYDQTGDNIGSVAFGLGSTGAIITGAALIMVAVFGGFAAGDLVMFQQMGFGLGVAVILDATIVRSVLVPATMALLGARNWYLPRWLEWLPRIHIEAPAEEVTPRR
ncbi:MAG TPA: MMPL family transporter [Acidimicrobiia bacterium]|nr:MMPL family transporter [Acidimicrobiia bacterium]